MDLACELTRNTPDSHSHADARQIAGHNSLYLRNLFVCIEFKWNNLTLQSLESFELKPMLACKAKYPLGKWEACSWKSWFS